MPFHPLPLFCAGNTKNLTFPSSPRPSRLRSRPSLRQLFNLSARTTSFFPSVRARTSAGKRTFLAQYSCGADDGDVVPRDKFLQLEPCERRAPTGTGYSERINPISSPYTRTDPVLYFPFASSFLFSTFLFLSISLCLFPTTYIRVLYARRNQNTSH